MRIADPSQRASKATTVRILPDKYICTIEFVIVPAKESALFAKVIGRLSSFVCLSDCCSKSYLSL